MRIHSAHVSTYERPWPSALRSDTEKRRGLIVTIFDVEGRSAQGEAAPMPPFTREDVGGCLAAIQNIMNGDSSLFRTRFESLADIRLWVEGVTTLVTARHALEQALLGLLGQTLGQTVSSLLGAERVRRPEFHRLVRTPQEARVACDSGARALKIKVTGLSTAATLRLVQDVRTAVGVGATLRVDANQAWEYDEAAEVLSLLAPSDIEFVEEPLDAPTPALLGRLQRETGVSIACDESVRTPDDLERLIAASACCVVVIKPMFVGGMLPALDLVNRAAEAGLSIVITSALDGDLAREAALVCAKACPPTALLACGLHPSSSTLLGQENPTQTALPHPLQAATVARPQHNALVCGDKVWTFRELREAVMLRAGKLRACGVIEGQRVSLEMHATPDCITDFWALTWLGAVPVLLDPKTPRGVYEDALEALGSVKLPTSSDPNDHALPSVPLGLDEERVILFTSGSTGTPRPVPLTTQQLAFSVLGQAGRLGHHLDDRWGCALPLHHIGGLSILLRTIWLQTTAVVYPQWNPSRISQALDRGDISMLSLVPSMLTDLLDSREDRPFPASTRVLLIGGAKVNDTLLDRCQAITAPVALTWGMTEAGSQVASNVPGDLRPALAPLATATIRAEETTLLIDSPLVGGSLASSDTGHIDADGRVVVTGRRDAVIISGGENISLGEIENAIESHPLIAEALVIGVKDAKWGERPWALVVPSRSSAALTESDLRDYLASHLGPYKTPDRLVFTTHLPRNAMGKTTNSEVHAAFQCAGTTTNLNASAPTASRLT